jgi:hypothetical protein
MTDDFTGVVGDQRKNGLRHHTQCANETGLSGRGKYGCVQSVHRGLVLFFLGANQHLVLCCINGFTTIDLFHDRLD